MLGEQSAESLAAVIEVLDDTLAAFQRAGDLLTAAGGKRNVALLLP
jgi:hypothetical protein